MVVAVGFPVVPCASLDSFACPFAPRLRVTTNSLPPNGHTFDVDPDFSQSTTEFSPRSRVCSGRHSSGSSWSDSIGTAANSTVYARSATFGSVGSILVGAALALVPASRPSSNISSRVSASTCPIRFPGRCLICMSYCCMSIIHRAKRSVGSGTCIRYCSAR